MMVTVDFDLHRVKKPAVAKALMKGAKQYGSRAWFIGLEEGVGISDLSWNEAFSFAMLALAATGREGIDEVKSVRLLIRPDDD